MRNFFLVNLKKKKKKKKRTGKLLGRIGLGLIVLQVKWHFKLVNNGSG